MQLLRLILAAFLAIAAAVAGLFTAAVVAVIAMLAYLVLMFRKTTGRSPKTTRPSHSHRTKVPNGDFIDVVASEVEEEGKDKTDS